MVIVDRVNIVLPAVPWLIKCMSSLTGVSYAHCTCQSYVQSHRLVDCMSVTQLITFALVVLD